MYLVSDALTYDIHSRLSRAFDDCILPQNIEMSPQPSKASQTRRPCPWTAPGNRAVTDGGGWSLGGRWHCNVEMVSREPVALRKSRSSLAGQPLQGSGRLGLGVMFFASSRT